MKYYLSSYLVGEKVKKLKNLLGSRKLGIISNSKDYLDEDSKNERIRKVKEMLKTVGIDFEDLDLREFFGKEEKLKDKLGELGGVWVAGGNTFVLRQAMYLSGFDKILNNMERKDFVYSGDSAGVCILSPKMDALKVFDDYSQSPYEELDGIIWEGLGILDYILLPHYKPDNQEKDNINKAVEYCEKNQIPYKTLKDGEVIIIE